METEGAITCVVADDHAALRAGVVAYLRGEEGFDVIGEASDGSEVLPIVERRRPAVLLIDARMSRLDGVETCRRIVDSGLPTRVVLYTGYDDLDLLEAALEAGATGFVVKSAPFADITRALRCAVAGQVYVDASLAGALVRRRGEKERHPLSPREQEVLQRLAEGCTTDETAAQLYLSPATVRSYAESAMHKLEARNRVHLVAKTLRLGLLQ